MYYIYLPIVYTTLYMKNYTYYLQLLGYTFNFIVKHKNNNLIVIGLYAVTNILKYVNFSSFPSFPDFLLQKVLTS